MHSAVNVIIVESTQFVRNSLAHVVHQLSAAIQQHTHLEHYTHANGICYCLQAWFCLRASVLTFKVSNGLAPLYLSDNCQLVSATSCR